MPEKSNIVKINMQIYVNPECLIIISISRGAPSIMFDK